MDSPLLNLVREYVAIYGIAGAVGLFIVRAYLAYLAAMAGEHVFPRLPPSLRRVLEPPFVYLRNIAIGLDITFNALLGGLPRETISGRVGRYIATRTGFKQKLARLVAKFLDWADHDHCLRAYRAEQRMRETIR